MSEKGRFYKNDSCYDSDMSCPKQCFNQSEKCATDNGCGLRRSSEEYEECNMRNKPCVDKDSQKKRHCHFDNTCKYNKNKHNYFCPTPIRVNLPISVLSPNFWIKPSIKPLIVTSGFLI